MAVAAICACAVACGGWIGNFAQVLNPPVRPAGLEAHETSAGASLLGQFRASASAWLYLHTDLYLHNGVEMRPLSDAEKLAGRHGVGAADDGHEQLADENNLVTVVPGKERDFRGVFGDLERATAAYKKMEGHKHNEPENTLPLFRLMTLIDPQFVPGWTMGATIIARDDARTGEALSYLKQGLRENPDSVEILSQLGYYDITRWKRLDEGAEWMERARAFGYDRFKFLDESELDALRSVYRWLGLCYRDMAQFDKLRSALSEGARLFPDDVIIARLLNPPPIILSDSAKKAWTARIEKAAGSQIR